MNRTEAKAYALNELGLERDYVRQFGNLSRTQTWLDAIAAQASEGIAAQAHGGIASFEASEQPIEPDPVPETDLSFDAFWESPTVTLYPQPLTSISDLDEDWDDSPDPTSTSEEVIVYPLVIALLMLWAVLQLLLLLTGWLVTGLTALANGLDAAATRRLNAVSPPERHNPQDQSVWILASS